ncbi:hypothetical protein FGL86_00860 [Pistricoccus aurantiacus]|uniref:Uncharacterized protein n=1 Tax=Pistricoccus aurantiacus TaxID=1883414 RepID=A0A5B8SNW3_9GAMM|nr:hypothetical protein [Pistricoccus aurantiacus]QEA37757.1 hypothetical protein FGL86_00860 [Pistricoccus aurantiacus]
MDNHKNESQTPQEELQHLREVNEPEDFEHLEPDEEQHEARQAAGSLIWLLPLSVALVVLVAIFFVVMSL